MAKASLASVPIEIVEQILMCKELSFKDVCSFGCTCTLFFELINRSNQIWKTKYNQTWPQLARHEDFKNYAVTNWFEEFRQRWSIGKKTMALMNTMSACHIKHEELSASDFDKFDNVFKNAGHPLALYFMINELMMFIHHKNRNTNLTNKYYSEKVIRHLRQIDLSHKWNEFKSLPSEEQLLEKGAVIVAQWCQPTEEITDHSIGVVLDAIANDVRQRLFLEHGEKHAALNVPDEVFSQWRCRNIQDNFYSPNISRQVICAISTVLFKEMGFFGNHDLYYSHDNSYINKVLELRKGIPITLSILFESVARRLGVKCEPVSFSDHFLLRWRDSYMDNAQSQYFYIDVLKGGTFLGRDSCPKFSTMQGRCPISDVMRFGPATAVEVVERLANKLEMAERQHTLLNGRAARLRSALELIHLVSPANLNCLLQLARFYMQYNMDVSGLRQAIEAVNYLVRDRDMGQISYIQRSLRDYEEVCWKQHLEQTCTELEVRRRSKDIEVKYAVGMVMHHRMYDYTCVVVGWDLQCEASDDWMVQMNVCNLSRMGKQPFYHVLVNDGSKRYAAEDNLEVERQANCWVTHYDVGRYFDSFNGTHYLPNAEMLKAYPDDLPVIYQHLAMH